MRSVPVPHRIRAATKGDARALARLHRIIFSPAWDEAFWSSALANDATMIWCAEEGETLAGLLAIQMAAGEGDVLTLGVHPSARRTGLARRFLSHALGELIHQSTERLVLEVASANKAAIALYKELGFVQVGVRANYYENGDDALVFAKDLIGHG